MAWPFDFEENPSWYVYILYVQSVISTVVLLFGIVFIFLILPACTSQLYKNLLLFHMIINYTAQIWLSSGTMPITILPMCGGYTLGFLKNYGLGTCSQLALSCELNSIAALSTIYLFFYRHQVLIPLPTMFSKWFIFTITIVYVLVPGPLFYYECSKINQSLEKTKFVMKHHLVYPRFWEPETIVFPNSLRAGIFLAMSTMAFMLIFMIACIFYFVCRLRLYLCSKSMSVRTGKMHRSLIKTLIYQTLVNYILFFLPTTGIIVSCTFAMPIPGFSNLCYVIYSFSDSCSILAMVASHSSYRKRFYKLISTQMSDFEEFPYWYYYLVNTEAGLSTLLLIVGLLFIKFVLPRATIRKYKCLLAISMIINYLAQLCLTAGTMPVTILPVCGGYTLGFLGTFGFNTCSQFAFSCHLVAISAAFTIFLFLYRKQVILPFPKTATRIFLAFITILYFIIPGPLFYFECSSIDQPAVKKDYYQSYHHDFPRFWSNETVVFRTSIDTEVFWAMLFLFLMLVIMFSSITFTVIKLLHGLKNVMMSGTTKRMHRSLMISLLWQTGMNYALFMVPMGIVILGCTFHLPFPVVAHSCYAIFATSNACGIVAMIWSQIANKKNINKVEKTSKLSYIR